MIGRTRVYKFCNAKYAIDNLRKRRLKLSTKLDLNDPFEFNAFSFHEKKDRQIWDGILQDLARKTGVLCFCGSWKDPVVWSHYADKHQGVALGFDVPRSTLRRVKYEDKRINFSKKWNETSKNNTQLMAEALSTKFKHWQYEDEYRYIAQLEKEDTENGLFFKKFSEDLILREVVIGAQSCLTSIDVRNAYGTTEKLDVVTGRLAFQSFKIVKQQAKQLQR